METNCGMPEVSALAKRIHPYHESVGECKSTFHFFIVTKPEKATLHNIVSVVSNLSRLAPQRRFYLIFYLIVPYSQPNQSRTLPTPFLSMPHLTYTPPYLYPTLPIPTQLFTLHQTIHTLPNIYPT